MAKRSTRAASASAAAAESTAAGGKESSRARRSAKARAPRRAPAAPASKDPIDAALELAALHGWRHVAMSDIVAAAGLALGDLYRLYPSRSALLRGFFQRLDVALLEDGPAEADISPRDRLFDVVMRRLDLLKPHREAVRSILRDAWSDPLTAACGLMAPAGRSLQWMLTAAGLEASGLRGHLRRQGLGAIYLGTLRVWLDDDTADMAKTMAALDRRLARAEGLLNRLPGRRGKMQDQASAQG